MTTKEKELKELLKEAGLGEITDKDLRAATGASPHCSGRPRANEPLAGDCTRRRASDPSNLFCLGRPRIDSFA